AEFGHLGAGVGFERREIIGMLVWHHHQMAGVVRVEVHDDVAVPAAMENQVGDIVIVRGRLAEDAAAGGRGVADIGHSPWGPEPVLWRDAPVIHGWLPPPRLRQSSPPNTSGFEARSGRPGSANLAPPRRPSRHRRP